MWSALYSSRRFAGRGLSSGHKWAWIKSASEHAQTACVLVALMATFSVSVLQARRSAESQKVIAIISAPAWTVDWVQMAEGAPVRAQSVEVSGDVLALLSADALSAYQFESAPMVSRSGD